LKIKNLSREKFGFCKVAAKVKSSSAKKESLCSFSPAKAKKMPGASWKHRAQGAYPKNRVGSGRFGF
jgi:hypothetical protein